VFENTANDYFARMGGAGTWNYPNYSDWHPVALTLIIGLKYFKSITEAQYEAAKAALPVGLFDKCDQLPEQILKAFQRIEEELGLPDERISLTDNDLMRFIRNMSEESNPSTRHAQGRVHHYSEILRRLERFFNLTETTKRRPND
jgi:hypothetical protein